MFCFVFFYGWNHPEVTWHFFAGQLPPSPSGGAYVTQNYQCQVGDQCLDFIKSVVVITILKNSIRVEIMF